PGATGRRRGAGSCPRGHEFRRGLCSTGSLDTASPDRSPGGWWSGDVGSVKQQSGREGELRGSSVRRVVSRVCFGAAAVAFVAALVSPGALAQTSSTSSSSSGGGTRPRDFGTATNAVGVDYVPDQQGGLTPLKDT